MFEFSLDKFILDDNNEYNNNYDLLWSDIIRRINNNRKTFFSFNFDEFEKTLRRKKLTHFSLSYLKTLESFKFDDIKWKIINFDRVSFFRYDCDFEILFKSRKNKMLVRESNSINYIIISKKSSSLIDFNDNSNVKLPKVIMLSDKYIDT